MQEGEKKRTVATLSLNIVDFEERERKKKNVHTNFNLTMKNLSMFSPIQGDICLHWMTSFVVLLVIIITGPL